MLMIAEEKSMLYLERLLILWHGDFRAWRRSK